MSGPDPSAAGDTPLFEIDGRVVTEREVLRAAVLRGELESSWRAFLDGVDAQTRASAQRLEAEEGDVESRSDAFRYDRDLLTAEDTEAWLEARGLTLDDLDAYCRRRHWAERALGGRPATPTDVADASPELAALFRAEWTLSGERDRQAQRLARRMAVFLDHEGDPRRKAPGVGVGEEERVLAMEAAYRERSAALTTPKARERVRLSLGLSLTRVQLEWIELPSLDAAREAVMCLREDGSDLPALARETGARTGRAVGFVEDLDDELRLAVTSAVQGDVLAPTGEDGAYRVHRLVEKREPDDADPEVLARIDREILEPHYADLVARRVRWLRGDGDRA